MGRVGIGIEWEFCVTNTEFDLIIQALCVAKETLQDGNERELSAKLAEDFFNKKAALLEYQVFNHDRLKDHASITREEEWEVLRGDETAIVKGTSDTWYFKTKAGKAWHEFHPKETWYYKERPDVKYQCVKSPCGIDIEKAAEWIRDGEEAPGEVCYRCECGVGIHGGPEDY